MIDTSRLQETIDRLEMQFENCQSLDSSQPQLIKEAVEESVIRRFNVCFDCLWKTLRIYLIKELGLPEVEDNPKPVFRLGNENNLLRSGVEIWLEYADFRELQRLNDFPDQKSCEFKTGKSFIKEARSILKALNCL